MCCTRSHTLIHAAWQADRCVGCILKRLCTLSSSMVILMFVHVLCVVSDGCMLSVSLSCSALLAQGASVRAFGWSGALGAAAESSVACYANMYSATPCVLLCAAGAFQGFAGTTAGAVFILFCRRASCHWVWGHMHGTAAFMLHGV